MNVLLFFFLASFCAVGLSVAEGKACDEMELLEDCEKVKATTKERNVRNKKSHSDKLRRDKFVDFVQSCVDQLFHPHNPVKKLNFAAKLLGQYLGIGTRVKNLDFFLGPEKLCYSHDFASSVKKRKNLISKCFSSTELSSLLLTWLVQTSGYETTRANYLRTTIDNDYRYYCLEARTVKWAALTFCFLLAFFLYYHFAVNPWMVAQMKRIGGCGKLIATLWIAPVLFKCARIPLNFSRRFLYISKLIVRAISACTGRTIYFARTTAQRTARNLYQLVRFHAFIQTFCLRLAFQPVTRKYRRGAKNRLKRVIALRKFAKSKALKYKLNASSQTDVLERLSQGNDSRSISSFVTITSEVGGDEQSDAKRTNAELIAKKESFEILTTDDFGSTISLSSTLSSTSSESFVIQNPQSQFEMTDESGQSDRSLSRSMDSKRNETAKFLRSNNSSEMSFEITNAQTDKAMPKDSVTSLSTHSAISFGPSKPVTLERVSLASSTSDTDKKGTVVAENTFTQEQNLGLSSLPYQSMFLDPQHLPIQPWGDSKGGEKADSQCETSKIIDGDNDWFTQKDLAQSNQLIPANLFSNLSESCDVSATIWPTRTQEQCANIWDQTREVPVLNSLKKSYKTESSFDFDDSRFNSVSSAEAERLLGNGIAPNEHSDRDGTTSGMLCDFSHILNFPANSESRESNGNKQVFDCNETVETTTNNSALNAPLPSVYGLEITSGEDSVQFPSNNQLINIGKKKSRDLDELFRIITSQRDEINALKIKIARDSVIMSEQEKILQDWRDHTRARAEEIEKLSSDKLARARQREINRYDVLLDKEMTSLCYQQRRRSDAKARESKVQTQLDWKAYEVAV